MNAPVAPAGRCDLHVHSTASDGTVPPREVARRAAEARLDAFALTDHDTFDGVAEAMEEGARRGVRVVPGVELSVPHEATCHVIALGVDPAHPAIRGVADRLRHGRGARNLAIVERLREQGIDVTLEEVAREAGGDVVARPHFARVLVKRGVVRTPQEAFDIWLGKGRPAYVDRDRVGLAETCAAARAAGGVSVLCHPGTLALSDDEAYAAWLAGARAAGLDAMEVRTGTTSAPEERRWEELADRAGLLPSGGSDFHGENRPGVRVGSGRGRLRVPTAWLEALLARAAARAAS
jgi:hypothetical protein